MRVEVLPAGDWGRTVAERLVGHPACRVCVPTGETSKPVYVEIARRGGLRGVDLVLLDEFGGLPAGHPGRCDSMIRRDLLDLLPAPPASFDRIDVDVADLDEECRRYEFAVGEGRLDLALLGLGSNGHVGLNEPGSALGSLTRVVQLHESTRRSARAYGDSDTAPTWGATIGMRALLAAGEVWLLVTGTHKAAILDEVLNGPVTPEIPASLLRNHPNVTAIADEAAAGA